MDMRKLVGRNAARLREAAGLTQEQLAERAGLSQQYISNLEKGDATPRSSPSTSWRQRSGWGRWSWCGRIDL